MENGSQQLEVTQFSVDLLWNLFMCEVRPVKNGIVGAVESRLTQ